MYYKFEAIFENGVFQPLEPVELPEHQRVTIHLSKSVDSLNQNDEPWTKEKNDRRCDLIDKEIEGSITVSEKAELETLQSQAIAFRDCVAPLAIEGAQKLHKELLSKKRAAKT